MKKMIFTIALFAGLSAQAQSAAKDIFSCLVPNEGTSQAVALTVTVQLESSADFVMFTLKDKEQETTLFSQTEKGEVENQLKQGGLNLLVLAEDFSQENGVLKNAGFFAVSKNEDGTIGGFLTALGNLYPLSCEAK